MASKKSRSARQSVFAGVGLPAEQVIQRVEHRRSGAAGTHADSNARKSAPGTYRTNRVGSRSAQRRAAVRDAF